MKALHGLCIFLVSASIPLSAQQPSSSIASTTTNTPSQSVPSGSGGKNRQINLDVVVTDKSGKTQAGLQEQDFTLLDDKAPQKVLSFGSVTEPPVKADAPVEIVLLLDTVNTPSDAISDARRHLDKYLRQNGGKLAYPTSLAVFSSAGLKMGAASLDGNALGEILKANNDIGLTSIHDPKSSAGGTDLFVKSIGTLNSLIAAKAKVPGRKIVIWIGSGWPLLAGAEVRMGPKPKQDLFASVVAASTALRLARVTLYNVDPGGSAVNVSKLADKFGYESFVKGVTNANSVSPANLALQVLATQTGGRVLINGNDISGQIQSCVDEANAFYVLSFAGAPAERPDQYHTVELKVNKPGLSARTSTGYYSQP
jgi:VWFA-related protein